MHRFTMMKIRGYKLLDDIYLNHLETHAHRQNSFILVLI